MSVKNTDWLSTPKLRVPDVISEPVDKIAQVSGLVSTLLGLIEKIARLSAVVSNDSLNIQAAAMKIIIEAIKGVLEDFLRPQSVHVLLIPPVDGGNEGLMNQIAVSTNDEFDINRPRFGAKTHLAGTLLMVGTHTLRDPKDLWEFSQRAQALSGFFSSDKVLPEIESLPTPSSLKIKIITRPVSDTPALEGFIGAIGDVPVAVQLSWDPLPQTFVGDFFGAQVTYTLKKAIIYRDTEPLPVDDALIMSEKEVGRVPFINLKSTNFSALDSDIEEGKEYFYAVGYEVESALQSDPSFSVTFEHQAISGYVPVLIPTFTDSVQESNQGTPPNWRALSNPLEPLGLGDMAAQFSTFIDLVEGNLTTPKGEIFAFLDALIEVTQSYQAQVNRFSSAVRGLQGRLSALEVAGAHIMAFSGKGSTQSMLSALDRGLSSDSPEAPKYDRNSKVAGVLVVGGASSAAAIQGLERILQLTFSAQSTSAVAEAIAAVGAATAEAKEIFLSDSMEPSETSTGPEERLKKEQKLLSPCPEEE